MTRLRQFALWSPWVVAVLAGCDALEQIDRDVLVPVAVEGKRVFYEHYEQLSDWEDVPFSLWMHDLETGESRRLFGPKILETVGISDGYYLFFEPWDDEVESRGVIGLELSTGEQFTIVEDAEWSSEAYGLDGSRVAYISWVNEAAELIIYDLRDRVVSQVVEVPRDAMGVWGFRDNQVLTLEMNVPEEFLDNPEYSPSLDSDWDPTGWTSTWLLIDLDTGEQTELSVMSPEDWWVPMPGMDALARDWVVASGMRLAEDEVENMAVEIVAWDISTGTWQTLATYEPAETLIGLFPFAFAFVTDVSETHVAVYSMTGLTWRTEAIDLRSGARTGLANGGLESLFASEMGLPLLGGSTAYWVKPGSDLLVVYDLDSGDRRTVRLEF